MTISRFLYSRSIRDWDYYKVQLDDGRFAVIWAGPEPAWDQDQRIICPIGPEVRGDQTGCVVYPDFASAEAAWAEMVSEL